MANIMRFGGAPGGAVRDENLVPDNIKSGVSILGVEGIYKGDAGRVYKGTLSPQSLGSGTYKYSATFPTPITTIVGGSHVLDSTSKTGIVSKSEIATMTSASGGKSSSNPLKWSSDGKSFSCQGSFSPSPSISYIATEL